MNSPDIKDSKCHTTSEEFRKDIESLMEKYEIKGLVLVRINKEGMSFNRFSSLEKSYWEWMAQTIAEFIVQRKGDIMSLIEMKVKAVNSMNKTEKN